MKVLLTAILALFSLVCFSTDLARQEVEFVSNGTTLSGTIVLPKDTQIKAAVIFVHGSGKQTRFLRAAERFAEDGIAALVYDKRGVGKSQGEYEGKQSVSEKNLNLLADDALAAFNVLSNHPKLKNVPLGMTGLSQAGWIVPIAATKTKQIDFLVLWSGPVCKVSEEDIYSKYTRDADKDVVPKYSEALNARRTPYVWPAFLGKDSDPVEHLAQLDIPGLWIFGAQDGSVPVDLSMQNLAELSKTKPKYEYVLFSNAGHNNMRVSFNTVTDWIGDLQRTQ